MYSCILFSPGTANVVCGAAKLTHFRRVEVAEVDGLGEVAVRFHPRLPTSKTSSAREAEPLVAHQVRHLFEDGGALVGRGCAPARRGGHGGIDGGLRLFLGRGARRGR